MTLACFATSSTRDYTPGPGAYYTESYKSVGDKYSIRVAVRPKYQTKPPITSEIDFPPMTSSLAGKHQTIGIKTKNREEEPRSPGPSYAPDPRQYMSKSVCIKSRYKEPDTSMYPGPANYSPQEPGASSKTKPPPMGARPKIVLADVPDSPGPAAYDIERPIGKSTPRYSIRPKTAERLDRSLNPGFTHNEPSNFGSGTPRWTMPRAKSSMSYENGIPGPGAYEQEKLGDRSRLSPAIRPLYKKKRPLTADVPLENTRRFPEVKNQTIGIKSGKGVWAFDEDIPGPSFMPKSTLERRSITIGEKRPQKTGMDTPGPSDYNPKDPSIPDPPVFTCKGPGVRDDWMPKKGNKDPGPGQYNLRKEENDRPKWIIGERSVTRSAKSRCSTREQLTGRRASRAQTALNRKRKEEYDEF